MTRSQVVDDNNSNNNNINNNIVKEKKNCFYTKTITRTTTKIISTIFLPSNNLNTCRYINDIKGTNSSHIKVVKE